MHHLGHQAGRDHEGRDQWQVRSPARREQLAIVPLRHPWRWVSARVILALLVAVLGWAMSEAQIQWEDVPGFFTHPVMLEGLLNTIVLAVVAQAVAIVLGVVVALMRLSANPVARWFAVGYIWLFRGLPVLLQILIWFNLALVFQNISIPSGCSHDAHQRGHDRVRRGAARPGRSTRAPTWPRSSARA